MGPRQAPRGWGERLSWSLPEGPCPFCLRRPGSSTGWSKAYFVFSGTGEPLRLQAPTSPRHPPCAQPSGLSPDPLATPPRVWGGADGVGEGSQAGSQGKGGAVVAEPAGEPSPAPSAWGSEVALPTIADGRFASIVCLPIHSTDARLRSRPVLCPPVQLLRLCHSCS
jgi:hypothetical protein